MTGTNDPPQEPAGKRRSQVISKIFIPVVVAVLGAIAVGALTPVGDKLRELLFPTKVAVSGTVVAYGQPAASAEVKLDGKHKDTTKGSGTFLIEDVGVGTHHLLLQSAGGRLDYPFKVHHGGSDMKLGVIQLKPLVPFYYFVDDQADPAAAVRHYDLTLWIEGDDTAIARIKSVRYTLPGPLAAAVVKGSPGQKFCYRQKADLPFSSRFFDEFVRGSITLRDGRAFDILAVQNAPGDPRAPANCAPSTPVTTSTPVRVPPPRTPPIPPPPPPTTTTATTAEKLIGVPSVVGQPFESATSTLEAAGLVVSRVVIESNQPANIVVAQDPHTGARVPRGTTITLSVSSGPAQVAVPDVTAQKKDEAVATLSENGFKASIANKDVTDPAQDGIVLAQDPKGGTELKPGATVYLTVGRYAPAP
jgi:hypothetical protein